MNIIVTGASRGIGYALVKQFASTNNSSILAVARNGKQLAKLSEECKKINSSSDVAIMPLDLSKSGASNIVADWVVKSKNKIDILINNAGLLINKPFVELTEDDFDNLFHTNVKSVFCLSQALINHFNNPAHIVNIASMGGVQGSVKFSGLSLYSASKGAVAILTEALAEELKERNIKVNCLAFGAVQTEMFAEAFPKYNAPLQPKEMAEFVADFAKKGGHFFNGKILSVSTSTP